MNLTATSKEDILKASRALIQQNGWAAVNIRAVAAACGVSVGCIYNYFASKTDLVSATVESIWNDIFHRPEAPCNEDDPHHYHGLHKPEYAHSRIPEDIWS